MSYSVLLSQIHRLVAVINKLNHANDSPFLQRQTQVANELHLSIALADCTGQGAGPLMKHLFGRTDQAAYCCMLYLDF